jgi:hypothetical protein
MTVVCWTCGAWYDNSLFAWSCPHERIFPHTGLTDLTPRRPDDPPEEPDADHPAQ